MPKKEAPIDQLQDFLPAGTYESVLEYLQRFKVHLTVAKERKSVLGDYRHRTDAANHRISVNGNLNQFAFLITLLHELAHLLTFEKFGNRVLSHGGEWKAIYADLLKRFLEGNVFPADIRSELVASLRNPAATSCAEDALMRVLRRYDEGKESFNLVEELPENALFRCHDGRVFRKGEKMRKRFKCIELRTGRVFLFSPVYEVKAV